MSDFDLGTTQRMTTETHRTTTFLDLLRRQMSVADRTRRKRTLRERLRFKCIACCGPTINNTTTSATLHSPTSREDEIEEQSEIQFVPGSDAGSGSGMNLATALEAERYNRGEPAVDMTPRRVSLMRLLDETAERVDNDGRETEISTASMETLTGNDSVCCVCMGRKKGAAFIPCGHTFAEFAPESCGSTEARVLFATVRSSRS